jgi:glycosyltransferase involved in cell wall biosynthesis
LQKLFLFSCILQNKKEFTLLSVLISCLFNRLENVEKVIKSKVVYVEYVVIVQGTNQDTLSTFKECNLWTNRDDLKIICDPNIGVTYSRNLAIEHANGDLALFTDDDVTLCDDFIELVNESFLYNKNCDFLTFNVEDENGDFLKPPLSKKEHNLRTILGVGTIQIAVRLNALTRTYKFPLNLGAGAKYPCCDEPVYLSIFLNQGHKGMHIHKTICQHPKESSGSSLDSYVKVISRLIAFKYIFGKGLGYIFFIVFIMKNINKVFTK